MDENVGYRVGGGDVTQDSLRCATQLDDDGDEHIRAQLLRYVDAVQSNFSASVAHGF